MLHATLPCTDGKMPLPVYRDGGAYVVCIVGIIVYAKGHLVGGINTEPEHTIVDTVLRFGEQHATARTNIDRRCFKPGSGAHGVFETHVGVDIAKPDIITGAVERQ